MRLNDRFISQDYYIFNGKLPNEEKFPQANVNMGPSTCETKTSEVEHYFINYWNRNSQLLVCLWRKKTLIKKLETKFNEKNIEINDKSRSLKHIAYTTGVDSVGSIKLNPRFLEYKRLRQQAILGHAFFHPPFSKNILIWSKMTYYEGGKNNFSPSEAI